MENRDGVVWWCGKARGGVSPYGRKLKSRDIFSVGEAHNATEPESELKVRDVVESVEDKAAKVKATWLKARDFKA